MLDKKFNFINLPKDKFLNLYSNLTNEEYEIMKTQFYKNISEEIYILIKSIQELKTQDKNSYRKILGDFYRNLPKDTQKKILKDFIKKKEENMQRNLCDYGTKTIDELIEVLKHYKKEMGGDTKVYLSDFEFNGKQTQFEISKVDEEKELFLFYEMHESLW